jgi:hypothetical protein
VYEATTDGVIRGPWAAAGACFTLYRVRGTLPAFTMAAFNVLVQWHGFQPYASGFVPLSMAEFSL